MSRSLEAHLLGLEPDDAPDPFAHMRPGPAPAFEELPIDLQLQRIEHIRLHITGQCRCQPGPADHAVLRLLWHYDETGRELAEVTR